MRCLQKRALVRYISVLIAVGILLSSLCFSTAAVQSGEKKTGSMVKNITVENGTFTTDFKPGNFTYSVYFEEFAENVYVSVELNNPRFEYTVKGSEFPLREEDNVVAVYVTDPTGEYEDEQYMLNIFFKANGLTYLDVENGIFSPQFDKFHIAYYVILENEFDTFEKAEVNWRTANKDAVVEIDCLDELNEDGTLPEGKRTQYRLTVVEPDGSSKEYRLHMYRKSSINMALDDNALLANIKINGGNVPVPSFKSSRSFYDIYVPSSIKTLDVQAYPIDKRNMAEVIGSTEMRDDQPIYITIKVTSDIYGTSSYYTLRCQYDTALYTEKYTDMQLVAYCSCAALLGVLIGIVIAIVFKKRKKSGRVGAIEYDEIPSEQFK